MSEIIPQSPLNIREEIVASIRQAAAEERAAAEAPLVEAPVVEPEVDAPEPEEPEEAIAFDGTAISEGELPQVVPGEQPKKRGRVSGEKLINNLHSKFDKRTNQLEQQIAYLNNQISQLVQMKQPDAQPAAAEAEDEQLDPQFIAMLEKKGFIRANKQDATTIKMDAVIKRYQYANPDHAAYEPLVESIVSKLPRSVPITEELLSAALQASREIAYGFAMSLQGSNGQPAKAGAATVQTPSTPQNGKPQITPEKAAALRAQSQSMRTEAGENVGSDLRQDFSLDHEGIKSAFLAALRKGG